jgi:hypothetical protein
VTTAPGSAPLCSLLLPCHSSDQSTARAPGWEAALHEAFLTLPTTPRALAAYLGAIALIANSARYSSCPGVTVDSCIVAQTALCIIGARAVYLDRTVALAVATQRRLKPKLG